MDSQNPSRFSLDVVEKKPLASPVPLADEIPTPEKPAQLPRRAGKRSLVFSSDVRRVSFGLHRSVRESNDLQDLDSYGEALAKKEQWASGSCSDLDSKSLADGNPVKLPEKREILSEFFNCMDSSIRLLKLKGSMPTFSNICASVQHLTERRFTYQHLAQLKHVLPEAILIKKVLLHDEATCCMKPELLVTIQVDAAESNHSRKSESSSSVLRKVFRSRLVELVRQHQEEDDIPEDTLPHPFDRKAPISISQSNDSNPSMLIESLSVTCMRNQFSTVSHMPPSFQRRFLGKTPVADAMKTPLACLNEMTCKDDSLTSTLPSPIKCSSKSIIHKKSLPGSPDQKPLSSNFQDYNEYSKVLVDAVNCTARETKLLESTPVKDILTPTRLMNITPKLQTPKRSRSSMICDVPEESVKRTSRTKLFATPRKNVDADDTENKIGSSPVEDVLSFLPGSLLRDVRDKERKLMQERDSGAAQARSRKTLISSLPKIFDSILLLFQSGNRSVITKQELVHKIISSHCSIVDKNEVEEQLRLLEELVPDWFYKKISSTGDSLYCVNKMSSSLEIRQRLQEAE